MSPERWREIQYWLDCALDLPRGNRAGFLAELDQGIRVEVENLMEAVESESALDHSPMGRRLGKLLGLPESDRAKSQGLAHEPPSSPWASKLRSPS